MKGDLIMSEKKNMVTKEQKFVESVIGRIEDQMKQEGFCIKYHAKVDNNVVKHGIEVFKEKRESKFQIGAIIYFEKVWLEISDDAIIQKLLDAVKQTPDFNLQQLMDREYILKNVYPMIQKIENLDRYQDLDLFYSIHDCFIILYYIPVENHESVCFAHAKVQKQILGTLNIQEEDLVKSAFENIKKSLQIQSMQECMEEMFSIELEDERPVPLMIVSNREKYFGASAILLPEVYDKLSKKLGEKFIIIPSSIHECLVTEYQDDLEMLVDMVKEVNETQVAPEDQLSDHIYLCTKEGVSLLK